MGNHGDSDGGYRGEASHVRTVLMYLLKRLYAGSGKADRRCFFKNELQNGEGEEYSSTKDLILFLQG